MIECAAHGFHRDDGHAQDRSSSSAGRQVVQPFRIWESTTAKARLFAMLRVASLQTRLSSTGRFSILETAAISWIFQLLQTLSGLSKEVSLREVKLEMIVWWAKLKPEVRFNNDMMNSSLSVPYEEATSLSSISNITVGNVKRKCRLRNLQGPQTAASEKPAISPQNQVRRGQFVFVQLRSGCLELSLGRQRVSYVTANFLFMSTSFNCVVTSSCIFITESTTASRSEKVLKTL